MAADWGGIASKLACPAAPGDCIRGRIHQRQSAAQQEEQEELEEAVVPPERQGSLHLQGSRGEGGGGSTLCDLNQVRPLVTCLLFLTRLQEKVASETLPLLGFTVKLPDGQPSEEEEASIFQLYHKNTLYYTFKAADNHTAQR